MMNIENSLEGQYAVPKNHPITCANPAPWKITAMDIQMRYDHQEENQVIRIYIRGEGSMWFNANDCFICDKDECEIYVEMMKERAERERKNKSVEKVIYDRFRKCYPSISEEMLDNEVKTFMDEIGISK